MELLAEFFGPSVAIRELARERVTDGDITP